MGWKFPKYSANITCFVSLASVRPRPPFFDVVQVCSHRKHALREMSCNNGASFSFFASCYCNAIMQAALADLKSTGKILK